MDNAITHDFWKAQNDKLQIEKDKLKIQLEEIDKLDKAFYDKADTLLSFTDNAHDYFLKGNLLQRRKIMEIISEEITYKDKNFDIKLKPIFQTIVENQYNLVQKNANNRTLETGIKKGLETNSYPNNRKNSPGCLEKLALNGPPVFTSRISFFCKITSPSARFSLGSHCWFSPQP